MFGIRDAEMVQEVVRRGGFRAAAQSLGIAQSAVSSRIALLERRLGIRIFDREKRRARLTPAGRRFLELTERLITVRNRIVAELAPENGLAGLIRIGVAETIVHSFLPTMLKHLHDAVPEVRFELSVETSPTLAQKLDDDDIDVAVMMSQLVPSEVISHPLATFQMGWFAAPGLVAAGRPLDAAGLARHPIVTFSKGTLPHKEVERMFSAPDIAPPLLHGSASLSTTLHLVRDGFGVGTLPVAMAADDLAAGRLVQLTTETSVQLSPLAFSLCHLPRQDLAIIQLMVEAASPGRGNRSF